MKKWTILGLVLVFILFCFSACAKKPAIPKAGSAKAEDMLTLLPKDSNVVIVIDINRALNIETVDKVIKENKEYQKYQEFIKETGLDPQKDIFFAAIGLTGEVGKQSGVGIINLKYNKDKLMAKIKEQEPNLKEETYNGINMVTGVEETQNPIYGAFLDESNVAIGSEKDVKAVIDILQKKGENVFKNTEMAALIKTVKKESLVWSTFHFTPGMKESMTSNPMMSNLDAIQSLVLYFDYKNKGIEAEIKANSPDEKKNKEAVDFLNSLKALGSMAAAQKPEVGELMNKIEITSAPDHVRIYANIPEDLLKKLQESAKKEIEGKLEETQKQEKQEEEKKD